MKKFFFIIFTVLISSIAMSQNIFDTTTVNHYGSELADPIYKPTKVENFIKQEVKKNLLLSEKLVLVNFWKGGMVPDYTDTTYTKAVYNRYLLFAYSGKNKWTATSYQEISVFSSQEIEILKSKTVNVPENLQLAGLKNNWDSLEFDWYLPFVAAKELNGKKGYALAEASDMGYVRFYAIDKMNVVYKQVYENDLSKEWNSPFLYTKNVNFDFNCEQPSFAAIIYMMPLFESKTFFSGYTRQ
ncbi:MAG: hypothetical protein QM737_07580 [Ferruginibacter sp.]